MRHLKSYSPYQFALFRVVFGIYLIVHFTYLLPYSIEIFSRKGMLPDASLNFSYGYFPNILIPVDTPVGVIVFISLLALLSLAFTMGISRRIVSLFLWYGWACLFHRNNSIEDPAMYFSGWLLLACSVIPSGEPLALGKRRRSNDSWEMPSIIFVGAWVIMALSYSISGFDKLITSPSWRSGEALLFVVQTPLARNTLLRNLYLSLPMFLLQLNTWVVLAMEMFFAPLSLWRKTRMLIWFAVSGIHIAILLLIGFADLAIGMLIFHLFVFDSRWFPPRTSKVGRPVVFVDGVCVLCDRFSRFVLTEDQGRVFYLSTFQGKTAKEYLGEAHLNKINTISLKDEAGIHTQTDAVFRVLSGIGGIWRIVAMLRVIPRPIRDLAYTVISRHRYGWFGKKEVCGLVSDKYAQYILE